VLGPIPGLIGCMQATEAIKLLLLANRTNLATLQLSTLIGKQVYYDGMTGESYTYDLPSKDKTCAVCGEIPTITTMNESRLSIESFERVLVSKSILPDIPLINRITVEEYDTIVQHEQSHVLLDVRSTIHFNMVSLLPPAGVHQHIINIPLRDLHGESLLSVQSSMRNVYVLCRRGNDSIRATHTLLEYGMMNVYNIDGGLDAWRERINPLLPNY
jgi:adenylyltransferase/sulfurtransferase